MPATDPPAAAVLEDADLTADTLPADDPLAGSCFRTVAPLGSGGTGEVVEAEHIALRKRVVVKLLHRAHAASPMLVERMRLEAEALGRIAPHPHIVEVTDVGTTQDGRPFIVMERLRGSTLRQEIQRRGHLPVDEAIGIALELLSGLAAAHRVGIVHRDVKPANLFLCDPVVGDRRTLKILDFGIAKVVAPESDGAPSPLALATTAGHVLGTPRYIAPEQTLGAPVDARFDLYSAACVVYAMLVGHDPFAHISSVTGLFKAHATELPEAPSRAAPQPISEALDAVVLRGLAKRPEDRFQNAAEFAAALQALPAHTIPRWRRTERLVPRGPLTGGPLPAAPAPRAAPHVPRPRPVLVVAFAIVAASVLASVLVTLALVRLLGLSTPRIEYRMTRDSSRLAGG